MTISIAKLGAPKMLFREGRERERGGSYSFEHV